MSAASPRSSIFNHPLGFWFFFWGEFAERCCFYGMRAILLLYMIDRIGFDEGRASQMMAFFVAGCYILPLLGGFVADRFLGKYWTIVLFSVPYVGGQLLLGIENKPFLFISLGLLAMGSGVIKPNISTLMGLTYDQQRPGQEKLRSDAFAMFYGSINIGSAISALVMPWLRDHYGYQVAFLFPAALMTLALLIFAAGKPFYARETVGRKILTPEEKRNRLTVLRRILGLFIVVTFFWSIFDQAESTWTLFARDCLDLNLFGRKIAPDMIQSLNPIFILILLPPVTALWHLLPRLGIRLRPTDKMLIGFCLAGTTMLIMSIAGFRYAEVGRVSILWEVIPYILITAAEICISVVGLELAFSAAPASMKSFVTACWLLTIFFGNIFNAGITPYYGKEISWLNLTLTPGVYFGLFALLMIPVAGAFIFVAKRFNRLQSADASPAAK
ncbi:MAG: MFS transporter [Pirellulales bacterium]|nr:MFS transporter [Pirellulales bacterium]